MKIIDRRRPVKQIQCNHTVATEVVAPTTEVVEPTTEVVGATIVATDRTPKEPSDFTTVKYVNDVNEALYKRMTNHVAQYAVNVPIQYIFFSLVGNGRDKQNDGTYSLNSETFCWPVKATIVSAHVHHSTAGESTLRMLTQTPVKRSDIASSQTSPYFAKNLAIEIEAEIKVFFSILTASAVPSAGIVLGVVFPSIDFAKVYKQE